MGSCKDCCKRYEGCQDRCPSFVASRLVEDDIRYGRKKERMINNQMFDGIKRSKYRADRKKNNTKAHVNKY